MMATFICHVVNDMAMTASKAKEIEQTASLVEAKRVADDYHAAQVLHYMDHAE
jgi:hypothetical protein